MCAYHVPADELAAALSYRNFILRSAQKYKLNPAVVAAVGSRESGWGTASDMHPKGPAGTGDRGPRKPKPPLRPGKLPPDGQGYGRGLMQADWDWSEFARSNDWKDPAANIDFGCNELADDIAGFVKKGLSADNALRAGLAAYNHGAAGVWRNIKDGDMTQVDVGTAHNNYSSDTLVRAEAYRASGFDLQRVASLVEASAFIGAEPQWPAENSPALDLFFGPIEVDSHGDLVRGWQSAHLTHVECPWPLTLSWDHSKSTRSILCNKKVADSLSGILRAIWAAYGSDYSAITRARMHLYGGCFEFRRKRGLAGLSLHAYGAAIDFDPDGNPMYTGGPVEFQMPPTVVDIFTSAGWKWGNTFAGRKDPMHFQATA